jgi:hypothetical protein
MAEPGTGKEGEPKTKPPTVHSAGDFFIAKRGKNAFNRVRYKREIVLFLSFYKRFGGR